MYEVLERWAAQASFSFAEGRLFFVYGPAEGPERLVPSMIRASETRTTLRLRYPKQVRDYTHVSDAGAAFVALLGSDVQGAVNVGSGNGVALDRLALIVGAATGNGLLLEHNEEGADDPAPVVIAETTRLSAEVGWAPRYSLEDGIRDTVDWWRAHGRMVQA
jgi:nucleoside-diphosphate-sugar epimerase